MISGGGSSFDNVPPLLLLSHTHVSKVSKLRTGLASKLRAVLQQITDLPKFTVSKNNTEAELKEWRKSTIHYAKVSGLMVVCVVACLLSECHFQEWPANEEFFLKVLSSSLPPLRSRDKGMIHEHCCVHIQHLLHNQRAYTIGDSL